MIDKNVYENLKEYVKNKGLRIFKSMDRVKTDDVCYGIISNGRSVIYFQNGTFDDGLMFISCHKPNRKTGSGVRIAENVYDFKRLKIENIFENIERYNKNELITLNEYLKTKKHSNYIED